MVAIRLAPGVRIVTFTGAMQKDSSLVVKTGDFNLPVKCNRAGEYKLSGGETVFTCFTSDFFLDDADEWRVELGRSFRNGAICIFS